MTSRPDGTLRRRSGFSIVEMLVAVTILIILITITLSVMDSTSSLWRRSSESIEAFQSARLGFDLMTRELSQATLNTYLDYDDPSNPTVYRRRSDLHFVCGPAGAGSLPGTPNTGSAIFFQAPIAYTQNTAQLGILDGPLNVCGFYIKFGTDPTLPPFASGQQRYRYRLMNLLVPTEDNRVYDNTGALATQFSWFNDYIDKSDFPVADNVIALVVRPEDPADPNLFPTLDYNSLDRWKANPQPITANQLPPLLNVTMVAIDETSARRMENGSAPPAAITSALASFQNRINSNAADISTALDELGAALSAKNIKYRIFSSKVPMRESKWTRN